MTPATYRALVALDEIADEADCDGEQEQHGYGCIECQYEAWHHTCGDDRCRGCNEPKDCERGGRPCKHCNPEGFDR